MVPRPLAPARAMRSRTCADVIQPSHEKIAVDSLDRCHSPFSGAAPRNFVVCFALWDRGLSPRKAKRAYVGVLGGKENNKSAQCMRAVSLLFA